MYFFCEYVKFKYLFKEYWLKTTWIKVLVFNKIQMIKGYWTGCNIRARQISMESWTWFCDGKLKHTRHIGEGKNDPYVTLASVISDLPKQT